MTLKCSLCVEARGVNVLDVSTQMQLAERVSSPERGSVFFYTWLIKRSVDVSKY